MTARKAATKPKPARKRAPAKKAAARRRPTRDAPHKPGPVPIVLRGFDRSMLTQSELELETPRDPWTEQSAARKVLMARRAGATHSLAAAFAKVHPYTVGTWISRGREAAGDKTLDELEQSGLDDESLAAAAFFVLDEQAEAAPAITALAGIARAADSDWRAGVALLRVLPGTKRDYSEVQKLEHSGPDGDAIPVEARAESIAEALRVFQDGARPKPELEEDDGAGDG